MFYSKDREKIYSFTTKHTITSGDVFTRNGTDIKNISELRGPFVSRIITIVDAYDAMTSERSYRGALPEEVAISELLKKSEIQFDSELVKVFIEKVLNK